MSEREEEREVPIKGRGQSQIHDGSRDQHGTSYESPNFGMEGGPTMHRLKCTFFTHYRLFLLTFKCFFYIDCWFLDSRRGMDYFCEQYSSRGVGGGCVG